MVDVKEGDCIASIAEDVGVRKFKTLWDANATLQGDRPNPNQLMVGDVVEEPKKGEKTLRKPKGARHVVVLAKKDNTVALNLLLLDLDHKPLAEVDWELTAPAVAEGKPAPTSGRTGADGKIEIKDFPVTEKEAKLKVTLKAQPDPPPPAPAPPVSDPPEYPAMIVQKDFKDKLREAKDEDKFVEWTLKVGFLPSFNDKTGVVARLENLGAPIDKDDRVERSIKAYQKGHMDDADGDGAWASIKDDIRDRHDTPGGKG